jgi:hypothetical protein
MLLLAKSIVVTLLLRFVHCHCLLHFDILTASLITQLPGCWCAGETANGSFPDTAVRTMAAIVANAEMGVDYYSQYNFIRY